MELDGKGRAIVAIFSAALALGALSWSALQLAALCVSGRAAPTSFGGALALVLRVPLDPTSPYPGHDAGQLPPVASWYLALLAILLFGALVVTTAGSGLERARAGARAAWTLLAQRSRASAERGARWARRADLAPLLVEEPTAGRLTLGHAHGQLVATEQLHSVLVVGPTGSRKTTGIAIPALLDWQGPVVCTSVKTDLLDATIARRRELGDVMIFDPAGLLASEPTAQWNPLDGCADFTRALRRADAFCRIARPGRSDQLDFWYTAAAKLLATLIHAAAISERSIEDVVRWVDTQERDEVRAALQHSPSDLARNAWTAQVRREERARSSIYTTAETALAAFEDEAIFDHTRRSEITPRRLLDGNANTLYLVAPVDRQAELRPLLASIVEDVRSHAYGRGAAHPIDPPLLYLLDEAANVATIPDLDKLASTGPGQGQQLVTILQDLAQLHARYGEQTAATIINNHHAKLLLTGISDPTTLDWAARVTGDEEVQQLSTTDRSGTQDSTTRSTTYRALAPAHHVREQAPGHGILIYGHVPPVALKLSSAV